MRLPFGKGTFIPIKVDVVTGDVPLLIGLNDLDANSLVADNVPKQTFQHADRLSHTNIKGNGSSICDLE